jgi:hypothetical protein
LFDEKYRIHPIYSIYLFRNVGIDNLYGGVVHTRRLLKHLLAGYAMADLVLQDFGDVFSENLAQALSHEKTKMFGDHKVPTKKGDSITCSQTPLQWHLRLSEKN